VRAAAAGAARQAQALAGLDRLGWSRSPSVQPTSSVPVVQIVPAAPGGRTAVTARRARSGIAPRAGPGPVTGSLRVPGRVGTSRLGDIIAGILDSDSDDGHDPCR
jgi:hypothetical protein